MAWLRDLGVAWDEIPLLDERIITRIIDPPRDERGRLRVRPKHADNGAPSEKAVFVAKWTRQGMPAHQIERTWREGLRA